VNPTFRKVALVAAVLGFVFSVFVAACGDKDEAAPTTQAAPATTEAPPATTDAPETTTSTAKTTPPITRPSTQGEVVTITVVGARPKGGIQRPEVEQGNRVTLIVRSDVADEVHLHGYDLSADAGPGKTARIVFTADVPGRFEIELEERGVQIAELTVNP
jgi:hypothetical protein